MRPWDSHKTQHKKLSKESHADLDNPHCTPTTEGAPCKFGYTTGTLYLCCWPTLAKIWRMTNIWVLFSEDEFLSMIYPNDWRCHFWSMKATWPRRHLFWSMKVVTLGCDMLRYAKIRRIEKLKWTRNASPSKIASRKNTHHFSLSA